MSKKKSRKTAGKGFGKPKKPHKLIRQNGLLLMDRKTLLETLRFVKEKEEDGFNPADAEKVSSDKDNLRVLKLSSIGHVRHDRRAVLVSVFHDPDTDTAYYTPLLREEMGLIFGMRGVDEDGKIVESSDAPKVQYAYTESNTFWFDLGKLDELGEMLPYHEPTLDELIYLGQMDERHSPLSMEELDVFMREIFHECGGDKEKVSKMYQMNDEHTSISFEVQIGTDGVKYYQPQKTRLAWSMLVRSVPVYLDKKGGALVPSYECQGSITQFL